MITIETIPLPASPALTPSGSYPLSLHIARRDILWVTGPACSGKTALLEHLALLRRPSAGRMTIMNYDAGPRISARTRHLLRQRIGLIEAMPLFMERLSLADNIALPLELAHFRKGDIQRETEAIIRWFGLEDVAQARPATLSHTTRLRAACARALITQPSIILIDEPALTLCPVLRERLLTTVRGLVKNGATALLATETLPGDMLPSDRHLTLPCSPNAPHSETSHTGTSQPDTHSLDISGPDISDPDISGDNTPGNEAARNETRQNIETVTKPAPWPPTPTEGVTPPHAGMSPATHTGNGDAPSSPPHIHPDSKQSITGQTVGQTGHPVTGESVSREEGTHS